MREEDNVMTVTVPLGRTNQGLGNKARSLYRLANAGLPVPKFAVLGSNVFTTFCDENELNARISDLLGSFTPQRAGNIAKEIADLVLQAQPGPSFRAALSTALEAVGDDRLAVRSSCVEEDGTDHSFAGQFDTFLNVQGADAVATHIQRCWASAYSARSLLYRHQHGLNIAVTDMAVILQRMVAADRSGVLFTRNPLRLDAEEMLVSAVWGLGEGLVSGMVDADTIVLARADGVVRDSAVGEKQERVGTTGIEPVPVALRKQICLSSADLAKLHALGERIEAAFGAPQDIEWCFEGNKLNVVQTRPVTAVAPAASVALAEEGAGFQIWDNSNIVENYPGVTGSLTFTFTRYIYGEVFREFARLLGIPRRQRREMDSFLGSVIGHLNGRMYYNLLHWYKLSGLAPFADLGRKMMEIQMGVGEKLDLVAFSAKMQAFSTDSQVERTLIRARTGMRFAMGFLRLEHHVARFRDAFHAICARYDGRDYAALPSETVYEDYVRFEAELVTSWGMMIMLESAIGLSYGVLRKLIHKWIPDAPSWLETAAIGGISDMESVAPARRLGELAAVARSIPELEKIIRETPSASLMAIVRELGKPAFVKLLDAYIADYSYRSVNELKLEEPDLRDNPAVLFDMLKSLLMNVPREEAFAVSGDIMAILRRALNPWQRFVFGRASARVRGAIRARETVRLCRSRAFGITRRMFRAMGDDLARLGVLESGSDVFHLRLDELRGCFTAAMSARELKPLVAIRRADFATYTAMQEPPPRLVTRGPIVAWAARAENMTSAPDAGGELRGISSAPGIAEGEAQVVQEASQFRSGVLVTYRTDPGWIPVFQSAKALLIERGSPLAHAAIVARELGVPTIVQIPGLTKRVTSGMRLRVDGHTGVVTVLKQPL